MRADNFLEQSMYDAGHFPASDSPVPVFSKPFWKTLVHETRNDEDRISILSSKSFVISNPNILPGVYTQPDAWLAWDVADEKRINIKLRDHKFAHNGCNRPMDSLNGYGSLWWNHMFCKAAQRIGIDLQPASSAEDLEWCKENEAKIKIIRDFNHPNCQRVNWTKAMTVELRNAGVDVLGNGGEFIILNPAVIDWERTREASGFVSKAQKAKDKLEQRFAAVEAAIRTIILSNQARRLLFFGTFRRVVGKRAIVFNSMIIPSSELMQDLVKEVGRIARDNRINLGLDASTDIPGKPEDYGFVRGDDGIYWHAQTA